MGRVITKMFLRGGLLLLPFIAYYIVYYQYLITQRKFSNDAKLIYDALDKSKKKTKKKKVIFGDSVGFQLYKTWTDEKKDYYTMTTTAPASVYSVYVLMENFEAINGCDNDTFYYVVHPETFYRSLKTKYFYNHFIKPFYTLENRNCFTPALNDSIQCIPYWYLAQLPFVKISDIQPTMPEQTVYIPQPIIFDYLKMIDSLSKKENFVFRVKPPLYLRQSLSSRDYTDLQKIVHQYGLDEMFSGYFNSFKYLPQSEFKDGIHYKEPEKFGENPLNL